MTEAQFKTGNTKVNTIIILVIPVIIIIIGIFVSSNDGGGDNVVSPVEVSANEALPIDVTTTIKEPDEPETEDVTPIYAIDEVISAGKFGVTASRPEIVTEIGATKTDNQYVVITLKVTNNDVSPRDISGNMFTLYDADKRKYANADVYADDFIVYETINPGLSITFNIAFETARDLTGFTLEADSGVLFAGGEPAKIYLGI